MNVHRIRRRLTHNGTKHCCIELRVVDNSTGHMWSSVYLAAHIREEVMHEIWRNQDRRVSVSEWINRWLHWRGLCVLLYNELVSLLFSYTLPGTTCINIPLNDSQPLLLSLHPSFLIPASDLTHTPTKTRLSLPPSSITWFIRSASLKKKHSHGLSVGQLQYMLTHPP